MAIKFCSLNILYRPITSKRMDPVCNGALHFTTPPSEKKKSPLTPKLNSPINETQTSSPPKNSNLNKFKLSTKSSPLLTSRVPSKDQLLSLQNSEKQPASKFNHPMNSLTSSVQNSLSPKNPSFKSIPTSSPPLDYQSTHPSKDQSSPKSSFTGKVQLCNDSNKENRPAKVKKSECVCSECGIRYKHRSSLFKHIQKAHQTSTTKPGSVKCLEKGCTFSCTRTNFLQQHLVTAHDIQFHQETKEFKNMKGKLVYNVWLHEIILLYWWVISLSH